ncbi:MAG TPA: hypothetical protein VMF51_15330 [Nocardioides sp.]|uniref:hypothetical protein n=1 Tax=Nocardioides sp. TaxID=35761 RepID=UPI002BBD00FB|nr:hypothetical protein [Nocardioides sp.]HTW16508.1 hypothetical protein [Nocardioides sp.]
MTDLMDRLSRARPTDDDLRAIWPAGERDLLLDQIRTQAASAVRRPRRRVVWLAAAAVTAAVVVPTVVDGGDAEARAELLRLASVASSAEGLGLSPGTYLHVRTESLQENSRLFADGRTLDTDREAWVGWDGTMWAIDTRPSAGWTEYHHFPASSEGSFGSPTPEFVAQLPDAPEQLRDYLDTTVSGSNSHDEALFVAVTDLAHSHLLDPATLAVALEAIADVDGMRTRDVVVEGREAVEISFRRFRLDLLGVDSFTIDRETAQVLRVGSSSPGGTYTSTTTLVENVPEIPAEVLAAYERYGNGSRICPDGREADGDGDC